MKAGIVAYNITSKWPVFGGLGVANEAEHTDAFIRVGTEYTFFLDKLDYKQSSSILDYFFNSFLNF